jgi:DNA-binding transcriptional LysR family regulator
MLKIEHLHSFITAADTGSIATAGVRLHMSPSAVSYAIDALEEQLGTCLLIRRRSVGVVLTADGVRLVRVARPWLQQIADIDGMFTARERKLTGELVVGCQEALSWSLAPRAIAELSRRHPSIDVSLKTIFMDQGNRPLIDAEVDVLITFLVDVAEEPVVDQDILCSPAPYAMMRRGHPLDREGEPVPLAELAEYPQLFIQDGPALDLFTGLYREQGLRPRHAMVTDISTAAQSIVGASDSISLRIVRPQPLGAG